MSKVSKKISVQSLLQSQNPGLIVWVDTIPVFANQTYAVQPVKVSITLWYTTSRRRPPL